MEQFDLKSAKIAVIGLGYVGLPLAIEFAKKYKVAGFDIKEKRIAELFASMEKDPTHGIGKPEALKYNLSGYWYRRIDWENRIVYKVDGDIIWVISLRGHYK